MKETENVKTGITFPINTLCLWLLMLRQKTNTKNLENALSKVGFISGLTEEEKDKIAMIKGLFIAEMNGDLIPPPSISEIYANVEHYIEESSQ
ncbi:hypothetical protein [Sulfuricurvum sp.]|uniref:hypothetical protein n=1 Tax=Sulfuricurvum sp. TaxID=2025608 RepID=UPI002615C14C|nr:hypothetical protein [Sulfuricurvum sp.]MDD3597916.1 hypothetical protein [Sulfuricurvum sp.]